MAKNYMTRDTAIKYTERLFSRAKNGIVTRENALLGAERASNDSKWFSYILTALGEHKLFTKKFTNGKISHLILTAEGREALKINDADGVGQEKQPKVTIDPVNGTQRVLTPESVNADVRELARLNPSFEVKLIFHPKDESTD
jgi:hypothetical protein